MQQAIAPGTVIDKRYQIQKKIPDTTSNRCYLAEDTDQSNRLVMISFPRLELLSLPGFTNAFEDACQRLMKARLSGLVKILDHGEYDSQPYSVLQYVTHETLANSLDLRKHKQKKVSVDEVLDWARPLAVTLDELHELDYVHSNVRPTMIYLGQKRQVLLGDFITEFTIQRLGAYKQAITSLEISDHLAPEYIKSNYNESYDQYLLATIVYEALAGRSHFHNPGSAEAYRRQVATKFPEPLLTHRPELVGASRILGKALERNPVKRFDSCREFVNQLGTAQVNPVFANDDEKPVTVIKKVIDGTVPDQEPIITSIRSTSNSGRKKGLAWLGVLLIGAGAGAYAVNHFGGVDPLKTKITTLWSGLSESADSEAEAPQIIVPISGNVNGQQSAQNSASSESAVTDAIVPTVSETSQVVSSANSNSSANSEAIVSATSGNTNGAAASAQTTIAGQSDSKINDARLQDEINRSLAEGEAEFIKNQAATTQSVDVNAAKPKDKVADAVNLALQEAQVDFMRQTSPADSRSEDTVSDAANAQVTETTTPDADRAEQQFDSASNEKVQEDGNESATFTPESTDVAGDNTEENTPLSPSEIESQELNAQMIAANQLADEQAAEAARLAEEKRKIKQEEQREAQEKAREQAKKKAEDEVAAMEAAETAKLQQQKEQAQAEAAKNSEAAKNEVVSAPVTKSFAEMQQERQRLLAVKAQKTARINSITKDCVTSGKIHRQVVAGNLQYVKNCLSVGVSPNLTQSNKWSLLHLASLGGYLNMAKLLVAKGATINAKAADGKTPLDMATEQKKTKLVTYLRSLGGVVTR